MQAYFDESGNTGSNWLDNQQPFFVYGGWIVKEKYHDVAINILEQCFSESKADELKSGYIWKRKRPQLVNFLNRMMDEAFAIPCFGLADKRYMIAAKIVETFFDCEYNPYVNSYLTFRSDLKKALADSISENEEIVLAFAELIKGGTIDLEKMRIIKEKIGVHFQNISDEAANAIFRLNDAELLKMIDEFETVTKMGTEKKWMSFVEPVLFDRATAIDKICFLENDSGYIKVDELAHFDDVFEQMNEIINNRGIFKRLAPIEICDSKEEPLIQSADLLSGFVARSFIEMDNICNDDEINKIWERFIVIRDLFVEGHIVAWEYYAKDDFVNCITKLAGYPKCTIPFPSEIIKRDMHLALNN